MSVNKRYILVCLNRRADDDPKGCCAAEGSEELRKKLKDLIERRGLKNHFRVIGTTCLGHCNEGAVVAVFPDDVWYSKVTGDDLERIVDEHMKKPTA